MPVTIPARDLSDMLTATIPHASTDKALALINAVRFESEKAHLVVVTTDRCTFGVARKPAHVQLKTPISFNLPLPRAKELLRMLKFATAEQVTVTLLGDKLSFDMGDVGFSATAATLPKNANPNAGWPDWRVHIREAAERKWEIDGITFDPTFLARLAKVPGGRKARFHFGGVHAPALAQVGDWFIALIMPMRDDEKGDPIAPARALGRKPKKAGGKS